MTFRGGTRDVSTIVTAGGSSLRRAVLVPWVLARRSGTTSIPYRTGRPVVELSLVLGGALEVLLADLILGPTWLRVVVAVLELVVLGGLLLLVLAFRAYPHEVVGGFLRVRYGAVFEMAVPLGMIQAVTHRPTINGQRKTVEISRDVLCVPFMGATNLEVTLGSPVGVALPKGAGGQVRAVRVWAADPGAGRTLIMGAGQATARATETAAGQGLAAGGQSAAAGKGSAAWVRALRWTGLLVLATEIVLVVTGVLPWRLAAVVLAVTEGTLTLIGLIAGAALLRGYRRGRAGGRSRSQALSDGLALLLPPVVADLVRRELAVLGVLALGVLHRRQVDPGDVVVGRGRAAARRLLPSGTALLVSGAVVLGARAPGGWVWAVTGAVLAHLGALAVAFGLSGTVRPHVLRGRTLIVRWGLRGEVVVPLASVAGVCPEGSDPGTAGGGGGRFTVPGGGRFTVPGGGRARVLITLGVPVDVGTGIGPTRSARTLDVPVDDLPEALMHLRAAAPGPP